MEDLLTTDRTLSQAYHTKYVKVFNKHMEYGTSGFRAKAEFLDFIAFRSALYIYNLALKAKKHVGVMISASHNPIQDNGFKFINPNGTMLDLQQESELETFVQQENIKDYIENIKENTAGFTVLLFRDTRPSSLKLQTIMQQAILGVGGTFVDFGEQTTPQAYFLVNEINKNEQSIDKNNTQGLMEKYYDYFASQFLVSKPIKFHLDCSNGVGYESFKKLLQKINQQKQLLQVTFNNTNELDKLNEQCGKHFYLGAEYVHKEKKLPDGLSLQPYEHAVSFDGDADRQIYYYLNEKKELKTIDGDRQAVLFLVLIKKLLDVLKIQDLSIGCIQTTYANGSSSLFVKNDLKIDPITVPTGVKHMHKEAIKKDIAVYFEANGHGSIAYSKKTIQTLEQLDSQEAKLLKAFLQLSNQEAGDAMVNVLQIEMALQYLDMSLEQLSNLFIELPNVTQKIVVKDKSKIKNTWNHSRVTEPIEIQQAIDAILANYTDTRAFIRPSGTEDIVRLYVETPQEKDLKIISDQIRELVLNNKILN